MTDLVETLTWLVDIPSVTGEEAGLRDAIAARLKGCHSKRSQTPWWSGATGRRGDSGRAPRHGAASRRDRSRGSTATGCMVSAPPT